MNRHRVFLQTLLLCGGLIGAIAAHAEDADSRSSGRLVLVHPDINQQLQQKSVVQIVEDKLGYLWFVTQGALHRFDGHDIVALPEAQMGAAAQLLGRNPVTAVSSAPDGMLWIATVGEGLIRFDPATGRFNTAAELGLPNDEAHRKISAVVATANGVFWISDSGSYFWRNNTNTLHTISTGDAAQRFRAVWFLADRLWLATADQLWWLDDDLQPQRVRNEWMQGATTAMTLTPSGAIMAFGSYGVAIQARHDARFQPFVIHHPAWRDRKPTEFAPMVLQALVEPDGPLWLLVAGIGVVEQHPDGRVLLHRRDISDPSGFVDSNVISMCRDRAGRLWFGTLSSGVYYRAEGHAWFSVVREKSSNDQHSNNNVFALLPDDNQGLWIGLENSGLRYLNPDGRIEDVTPAILAQLPSPTGSASLRSLSVRSIVAEGESIIIGHSAGLFRYWPAQGRVQRELSPWLERAAPLRSAVRSMRRRHNGDWLIASDYAGLLIWQKNGNVIQYHRRGVAEFELPTDRVLDVIEDQHQQIWLATDAGVLRLRQNARAQRLSELNQSHFFNTFHMAGHDELWIGSFGGIIELHNLIEASPSIRHYSTQDGLRDNIIYAIQSDNFGQVWASSNLGLMRLSRGGTRWQHFDRQDGLSDDEFNINAATRFYDGRIAFGGISGVTVIDPRHEPMSQVDTPLVISALQTAGQSLQTRWSQHLAPLELSAENSQLLLRLASPGTRNRHHQHFFYRFAHETEWRDLRNKRELFFANLPIGQAELELAWTYGEQPSVAALRLPVTVIPVWWQRKAVQIGFATSAIVALLYWLWSRRRRWQQRLQQEKNLRASDERLRLALWGSGDALWDWQIETGQVTRTGFEPLLGFASHEIQNTFNWRESIIHPDDAALANNQLQLHLDGVVPFYEAHYRLKHAHGDWIWVVDRGHVVERDAQGKPTRLAGTMRDVSEKHRREEELQILANYDSLTHLPNRTLFHDRLQHAIKSADRRGWRVAVVFIDLDRFKSVNDSYGHPVGDALLCAVAARLRDCVRAEDTIARLSGDEFTLILNNVIAMPAISRVVDAVQQAFHLPFTLGDLALPISPSLGISVYPDDADSAEKLLNHADMAMYAAKEQGRNTARYFEPSMNDAAQRRASISLALRKADSAQELMLHFQPRLHLKQQSITGVEALLRWNSHSLGAVSPAEFIPIAEEFGLIGALGYWVLEAVIKQLHEWQNSPLQQLPIAVNVSIRQLFDPNFQHRVAELLHQYRVAPSLLHIEVTETVLMDNVEQAIFTLQALRDMGIAICIDDFGTGYSSLGYLRRLPIDGLKVDKSFVGNMMRDNDDAVIVDTIIAMAHALRFYVVAEGVETIEQLEFLREKGCEEVQGFWLARPMPASDCRQFITQFKP